MTSEVRSENQVVFQTCHIAQRDKFSSDRLKCDSSQERRLDLCTAYHKSNDDNNVVEFSHKHFRANPEEQCANCKAQHGDVKSE
jgi:hypothetical protein